MALTDDQLERYARHIILKEVGGAGQARLLASKVLVIGAGGLGAPVALYLAAAGVGTIGLIDDDEVALSNLQRQIIYTTGDVGRPKVERAKAHLNALNPDVTVNIHRMRITPETADGIISGYDIVADGCDNFATRFAVNDACYRQGRTLVSAAVGQFDGQLATFKPHAGAGLPCYRCFVPAPPPDGAVPNCAEGGIIGALTGVVGSLQAMEVIKEITGVGRSLAGRLMLYDALDARFRTVTLAADPHCRLCGTKAAARG